VRIPQNSAREVKTVHAQRAAEIAIVLIVILRARSEATVTTPQWLVTASTNATAVGSDGVHRPERRSRRRHEQSWMGSHVFGCPFTAHEAAGNKNPSIQLVEIGA
jgi:hypothetical protein